MERPPFTELESHKHALIVKHRLEQARQALQFHDTEDMEDEVEFLLRTVDRVIILAHNHAAECERLWRPKHEVPSEDHRA